MLDKHLQPTLRRLLEPIARGISASTNATPNQLSLAGLALVPLLLICGWQQWWIALLIVGAINRLLDGLDGTLARSTGTQSDIGGVLDITCDYAFYAGVPLAFALGDSTNLLPAIVLITSFYINAGSFLGMAILEEKLKHAPDTGTKSFYHSPGLLEGTETLLFFATMCLLPQYFPILAYVFAVLTLVTASRRLLKKS